MPQAALPDINTILVTYRREMIVDLKSKRYSGVLGSLLSMNAVLPKKYQVEISTLKYNEGLSKNTLAVCNHCKNDCIHCIGKTDEDKKLECIAEHEYSKLLIEDVLLSTFGSLALKSKYQKRWKCQRCKNYNNLSETELIKPEPKKPFFLGIVPDPPILQEGLISEINYSKEFEAWARNFMVELEYQMGKYRVEYKPSETEEGEEFIDGGETEKEITLDGF